MTGALVRVKRGDKVEDVEIEYLTETELMSVLAELSPKQVADLVNLFCKIIQRVEPIFLQLERDGIIQRATEPQDPSQENNDDGQSE